MFEYFIINARTDICNIIFYIDAYEREHQSYRFDDGISGGGCSIPTTSKIEASESLGATIYFIGCWLKALEHNFLERCRLYTHLIKELFQKILVGLTNKPGPKENANDYYMLSEVVGMWTN